MGDGRVVLGAEVTATVASEDPGFFNYTDYEYSALRNFRVGVTAEVRASQRLQFLGELRVDHGDRAAAVCAVTRASGPGPTRRFDIQVGRIPPTFGAFGRGTYGTANMLIGTPLAYQYLTSLRPDALPATADDLIRMRGRGWLANFPFGNTAADRGLPIINSFRWDTGVQVHGVNGLVEWTGAVTTGSLSNPRVDDDNGGRQLAGRAVVRPAAALALGVSLSRGAFLSRSLEAVSRPRASRSKTPCSRRSVSMPNIRQGRFLGRGEVIWSRLDAADRRRRADDAGSRATVRAGRSALSHSARACTSRRAPSVWASAAFARRRGGFAGLGCAGTSVRSRRGYSIIRNVMVKASWQRNLRDGGRVQQRHAWRAAGRVLVLMRCARLLFAGLLS